MVATFIALLVGCAGSAPPDAAKKEKPIPEQCRPVQLDAMAADWVLVRGKTADPKTRLRVMDDGAGGYAAWYTGGAFTKIAMIGKKKPDDGMVVFVEQPTAAKEKWIKQGSASLTVLHVKPDLPTCVLVVQSRTRDGAGKETITEDKAEYAVFPKSSGVTLAWQPATEFLFLGDAAKSKKIADKQLAELDEPRPDIPGGKIPVAAFSAADADGDASCTFDMDLWFDDQPGDTHVAAGQVKDGFRSWYVDWNAPYSGNHYFEIYRYATCGGGERKLLGIASVSAVLM